MIVFHCRHVLVVLFGSIDNIDDDYTWLKDSDIL